MHQMQEMLKHTGRSEAAVGWYHSHPGYGCWLSNVDCQTAASFEKLHPRCVSVVIDPIQSVPGKVVVDAFRLYPPMRSPEDLHSVGAEPRQTTSNVGHLVSATALMRMRGVDRVYYRIPCVRLPQTSSRNMLVSLNKSSWWGGLQIPLVPEKKTTESLKRIEGLLKTFKKKCRRGCSIVRKGSIVAVCR